MFLKTTLATRLSPLLIVGWLKSEVYNEGESFFENKEECSCDLASTITNNANNTNSRYIEQQFNHSLFIPIY
jgi:hypothetical protein